MRVRTESKREAILAAAAETFCELGFERASMAEIASRVGGSKATLYGYFASKDELFVAVAQQAAEGHLAPAFEALETAGDPSATLRRFGEQLMQFVCSPDALQATRMVLAEAGNSSVGRLFYETGPGKGLEAVAAYLGREMDQRTLRQADPVVAAQHLQALLNAELLGPLLYGVRTEITEPQIKQAVDRAVAVFLCAYRPSKD